MTTTYGKLQPSADVRTFTDDVRTSIDDGCASADDGCSLSPDDEYLSFAK